MHEPESIFEVWAPPGGDWSAWVKPVLFAHLPRMLPSTKEEVPADVSWATSSPPMAIVVELPGAQSVAMGLALAERGFRPVPLFNACPPPEGTELGDLAMPPSERYSAVDVDSILAALVSATQRLHALDLPLDVAPAFLLDAERQGAQVPVRPGMFDNRSVVFVTDFPSAQTLLAHGISQATVVVENGRAFQGDLEHALRIWAGDGIALSIKRLDRPGAPEPLRLPRPSWLIGLWIRLASSFGLRRNPQGGFGGFVPEPSAG